jgi:hypothetical protein
MFSAEKTTFPSVIKYTDIFSCFYRKQNLLSQLELAPLNLMNEVSLDTVVFPFPACTLCK